MLIFISRALFFDSFKIILELKLLFQKLFTKHLLIFIF